MKQTDLEVSDLKRKIKLRFNEIQQSGKPNQSMRNLKSEHVREKTLAKGFRWHDQNTDQICFPRQNVTPAGAGSRVRFFVTPAGAGSRKTSAFAGATKSQ